MMVAMAERCALLEGARMLKVTAWPEESVRLPSPFHLNPADCNSALAPFTSRAGRGREALNQILFPGVMCCQIGTARFEYTSRTMPWRSNAEEIACRKRTSRNHCCLRAISADFTSLFWFSTRKLYSRLGPASY